MITMSSSFSQELLISTLVLLVPMYFYFRYSSRSKNPTMLPTNWPILHMLPSFLANSHNLHDYLSIVLAESGHNFKAHGPVGSGMRLLITCDPANVRHIFTTNYTNFPKGAEFAAIFDIMAGSLFTIDGAPSLRPRAKIQSVLSSPRLVASMATCFHDKVENGLLPLFSHLASTGTPFDMQEMFSRFMFDLAATPLFGVDPGLLSFSLDMSMPPMDAAVVMDTVMEVGFIRHLIPTSCWKAMRRLNIGSERKLRTAHTVLRRFAAEMIEERSKITLNRGRCALSNDDEHEDILSSYINDPDYTDNDLLHAVLLSFMLAGRDTIGTTLPWVFYNLAQNPGIVSIIHSQLSPIASRKVPASTGAMMIFEPEDTKPLVYLRAALYETLRLYPSAPIERKTVAAGDIMPSGHEVKVGDTILISLHSMGRMEDLWGKDCLNYNPNRWLSKDGNTLRYVPSHKFLAFNSGSRICPGKEIAVMQMKTVVATVLWNFDVEVVEGQIIQPKPSCILQMKNGFIVKLRKREL
ncbi:noroxomaritidine synthase 2-like [Triticum dicoccoides]|uniref:noroxomaritidine synthase 2-like n=1 Tax=Triticum dicoccoides TaxID=85692 RepID=UPI00188F27E2|nr:noroxomaritidine synthase 2-like [Triticum dicoccoides]